MAAEETKATGGRSPAGFSATARLAMAFALLCGAIAWSYFQPFRPEPLRAASWQEWFLYPKERNAFLRAPFVDAVITDAVQPEGSDDYWIIGEGGMVLHSPDGGATWKRVVLPDTPPSPAAPEATGAPRASWSFPGLVSVAHAVEAPPPSGTSSDAGNASDTPAQQLQVLEPPEQKQAPQAPTPPVQVDETPPPVVEAPEQELVRPRLAPSSRDVDLVLVEFLDAKNGWIFATEAHAWRTRDGGATWELLGMPLPSAPRAVSFATPSYGWHAAENGLWETLDGGHTWDPLLYDGARVPDPRDVALTGEETGRVVAGNRILERVGVARWSSIELPEGLADLTLAEDGTAWAFGLGRTQLLTDGGTGAWTVVALPELESDSDEILALAAGTRDRVCVYDDAVIACTKDRGASWVTSVQGTEAIVRLGPFVLPTRRQVRLQASGTTWRVDRLGVQRAADADLRWSEPLPPRPIVAALDRDHLFLAVGRTLFGSSDAGASFEPVATSLDRRVTSIAFHDAEHGFVSKTDSSTQQTDDGGRSWEDSNIPQAFEFSCRRLSSCLASSGAVVGRTTDRGETWNPVPLSSGRAALPFVVKIAQAKGPDPIAWAIHGGVTIFESLDDGASWKKTLNVVPERPHSLALLDARTAFVAGKKLWRTTDRGASWKPVAGVEGPFADLSFADARLGLLTTVYGQLLRTQDGGESWEPLVHRRYPGGWFYAACALVVLLVWPWPNRAVAMERTIADVLASDRPLRKGDLDALRFGPIANGLADFLKNSRTEPPLTLAITGEWGSGKSSLMNLLKERLEAAGYCPVWFNAWHHQKGEHLFASLYANIRQQAIPRWFTPQGVTYRWKLVCERVRKRWLVSILVVVAFSLFLAWASRDWSRPGDLFRNVIQPLMSGPRKEPDEFVAALMKALGLVTAPGFLVPVYRALRTFGVDPARLRNSSGETAGGDKAEPGARFRFAREFAQFTRSLHPRTLVLFIDDLDRCSKQHVVEVLEAVNFLVVSGECFVVLGMAEEWVERCIELAFNDLAPAEAAGGSRGEARKAFAKKYLEKLINIRVPIRKPSEQESRELIEALAKMDANRPRESRRERAQAWGWKWAPVGAALAVASLAWWVGLGLSSPGAIALPPPPPEARGQLVFAEGGGGTNGDHVELTFPVHAATAAPAPSEALHVVGEIQLGERKAQLVIENGSAPEKSGERLLGPFPLADGKRHLSVVLPSLSAPATTTGASAPRSAEEIATYRDWPVGVTIAPLDPPRWIWVLIASGVAFAWLAAVAVHWQRQEPPVVYDSEKFAGALTAWVPWILARRETPRALKRFINHVRYVAMREHAETADQRSNQLNDEALVALASLYHFDRRLVTDDVAFDAACAGRVGEALDRLDAKSATTRREVENAREVFARFDAAPTTTRPSDAGRQRFLRIMADLATPPAPPANPPAAS